MRPIRRIIVHHTASPSTTTVEEIRRWHTAPAPAGRGWSDVGYHLVVREGPGGIWLVEAGRPVEEVGAHDEGQNADSIGVAIAGDYTRATVAPAAWELLVGLVAGLLRQHGLTADALEGHREHEGKRGTACPGFEPAALRRRVAAALVA